MDQRVKEVQQWLNNTYQGKTGYNAISEDGITGSGTCAAIIRALQIEVGITSPNGVFGPGTIAATPIIGKTTLNKNLVTIVQSGLYCKGYDPKGLDGIYGNGAETAVINFKSDTGAVTSDGSITPMYLKALLNTDAFVLLKSKGGSAEIRESQQMLNRYYALYYWKDIGLVPCDGLYGRSTSKALIYALQVEAKVTADGIIGNGTLNASPVQKYLDTGNAVRVLKAALYCNGYDPSGLDSNFSLLTKNAVEKFQKFMCLDLDPMVTLGSVNRRTWASLMVSKGDPERKANACDCATQLDKEKSTALSSAGYKIVGRYLTGTVGGNQNKFLTREEMQVIVDAGLKFFPIYQDGKPSPSYFSYYQGCKDAKKAFDTAQLIGVPLDTIIYFAVDYDITDAQVTSNVLPYFKGINDIKLYFRDRVKIGIYGPRNVCTRVSDSGYAISSFVCDMSTGFSGNLGYQMPENWAYDQFNEFSFKYNAAGSTFALDKNMASNRAKPVGHVIPEKEVVGTGYHCPEFQDNSGLPRIEDEFLDLIKEFELAHHVYYDKYVSEEGFYFYKTNIAVLSLLRSLRYNGFRWAEAVEAVDMPFLAYIKGTELWDKLNKYIKDDREDGSVLLSDGKDGTIDIPHLAVVAEAYLKNVYLKKWTSWAGDLASAMKFIKKNNGSSPSNYQEIADVQIGKTGFPFNDTDMCNDADGIYLADMMKRADNGAIKNTCLSKALEEYYMGGLQGRRWAVYYKELGFSNSTSDACLAEMADYLTTMLKEFPAFILTELDFIVPDEALVRATSVAFAKYLFTKYNSYVN